MPLIVLGLFALFGFGIAVGMGFAEGGDNAEGAPSPSPVPSEVPSASVEDSPAPDPPAQPRGRFGLASCDVEIDSSAPGGIDGQLIGSTRVRNTGEVELRVRITFTWLYGDGTREQAEPKTVTVPDGRERLVFFRHPVTIDEIGRFQNHPDYFDSRNCKTKATILN